MMKRILPWVLPVLLILLWQASARPGLLSEQELPAPTAVAQAAWRLSRTGELWTRACRQLSWVAPSRPGQRVSLIGNSH